MAQARSTARFNRNRNQYIRDRSESYFMSLPAYVAAGNERPVKGDKPAWAAYRKWADAHEASPDFSYAAVKAAKQKAMDDMIEKYRLKMEAEKEANNV